MIIIDGKDLQQLKEFVQETNYNPQYFTLRGLEFLKPPIFKLDIKQIKKMLKSD